MPLPDIADFIISHTNNLLEGIHYLSYICYNGKKYLSEITFPTGGIMSLLRLDKVLSDSGAASRSEAKKLISSGRVVIHGTVTRESERKVDPENDEISVDGRIINSQQFRYFMLYKPEDVISATEDNTQKTVLDLLPSELKKLNLFPVGRLDKDTTGLLILTNDGDFCHSVTSPKRHVEKLYEFTVDGSLKAEDIEAFKTGLVLRDGTECLPALLRIDSTNNSHGYVTVFEGKYHQVKRMLASRGTPVISLKRISIGGLVLDSALKPGEYRELDGNELNLIFEKNVAN